MKKVILFAFLTLGIVGTTVSFGQDKGAKKPAKTTKAAPAAKATDKKAAPAPKATDKKAAPAKTDKKAKAAK